jgi:protocatechuate 3,4-dioxygenase beta subunit
MRGASTPHVNVQRNASCRPAKGGCWLAGGDDDAHNGLFTVTFTAKPALLQSNVNLPIPLSWYAPSSHDLLHFLHEMLVWRHPMRFPAPAQRPGAWWRRPTSRRALLRGSVLLSPALLIQVWGKPLGRRRPARGAAAGVMHPGQAAPACMLSPVLTEGPYFVDELLYRSDVRADPATGVVQDGVPLALSLAISSVGSDGGCSPLVGAAIDIWQCNALGVYSDVNDPGFNTKGQQFLRGTQQTDDTGTVQFLTIYPGWYSGRAVHIHLKVRTDPGSETGYVSNTQLFFDDALSDQVFTLEPYAAKGAARDTRNADDGIYQQSGGATLLDVQLGADGQTYQAAIGIGIDLSNPVQSTGPPGGPSPGAGPPPGGG